MFLLGVQFIAVSLSSPFASSSFQEDQLRDALEALCDRLNGYVSSLSHGITKILADFFVDAMRDTFLTALVSAHS